MPLDLDDVAGWFSSGSVPELRLADLDGRPDVMEVVGTDVLVRLPWLTDDELPVACFERLPQRYAELQQHVPVRIPEHQWFRAVSNVPPMTGAGPTTWTLVRRVAGPRLDEALSAGEVPAPLVEELLTGLAAYLGTAITAEAEVLDNTTMMNQYVWSDGGVWLVEVMPHYVEIAAYEGRTLPLYCFNVARLLHSLLLAERGLGQRLEPARSGLEELLSLMSFAPNAVAWMRSELADPEATGDHHVAEWSKNSFRNNAAL